MLNDIRESEGNRREWIVEILKDIDGKHTGFLHMGELVRCKECKHSKPTKYANGNLHCSWHYRSNMPDDFCSYGERREP